jgi:hypothetical protein
MINAPRRLALDAFRAPLFQSSGVSGFVFTNIAASVDAKKVVYTKGATEF